MMAFASSTGSRSQILRESTQVVPVVSELANCAVARKLPSDLQKTAGVVMW